MQDELAEIIQRVRVLEASGASGPALELLAHALARRPDDLALRLRQGVLLREAGRLEDSLTHLRGLAAEAPRALWVGIELAASLRRAGRHAEADETLQELLTADPRQRQALVARIEAAAQELRYDLALEATEAALAALPGDLPLRLRQARLMLQRGHVLAARDRLEALAAECPEDPETDLARAQSLLDEDPEEALQLSEAVIARAPDHAGAWPLRIAAARTLWRFDAAESWGAEAADRFPGRIGITQARFATRLALDGPEAALALLPDAPLAPALLIARGNGLLRLGRPEEADAAFAAALETGGLLPAAASGRIAAAQELDRVEPVRRDLYGLVARHCAAGHRNADRIRAEIEAQIGDWPRTERICARLLDRQGADTSLLHLQARASLALGRTAQAETSLRQLLTLDPAHCRGNELMDTLCLASGRPEDYLARRLKQQARPDSTRARRDVELIRDLDLTGRHDAARKLLDATLRIARGTPNLFLANELTARGRPEDATAILPRIVRSRRNMIGAPDRATTGAAQLARLFDFETGPPLAPSVIPPSGPLAWHLTRDRSHGRPEWTRRAERAGAVWRWLAAAPADAAALEPWLRDGEIDRLRALPRPCILATTHFGPLVFSILHELYDDFHYLGARSAANPATDNLGRLIPAASHPKQAAADAMRALRKGSIVLMTHDMPGPAMRRGPGGGLARGRLFGQPIGLLDTMPKLAAGLKLPSLMLQPLWRDGRISFDITPLPRPETGEDGQAWLDRWAAAYLERIEWMMRGAPENQNLQAMLWRWLLFTPLSGKLRDTPAAKASTA
ncbi:hypothetical protein [Rhodovulum sulfidophilum]|uniref:hypothetical protein n=1 Tax=Rhodovulum sulfidophilum TaxID=35806 RepID=UPI0009530041|nr:hypothetical protein [Rhodovulum sulfidophilum]OLS53067.1 hypothetical protein BV392_14370 [Rhodovulum sulfidophilum]